MLFSVHAHDQGDWTVIEVGGDLDLASAPRLRSEVVNQVAKGRSRLVLDLAGVDFCDSTGLGVLVGALKRARVHGGDLRLAALTPPVSRVIHLTRLDRAFDLFDVADDAVTAGRPAEV